MLLTKGIEVIAERSSIAPEIPRQVDDPPVEGSPSLFTHACSSLANVLAIASYAFSPLSSVVPKRFLTLSFQDLSSGQKRASEPT